MLFVRKNYLVLPILLALCAVSAPANVAAEFNADGVKHYDSKDWGAAIDAFQKALGVSPQNVTVRRNLCNAYQAHANDLALSSNLEGAIEILGYAINADPDNARPLAQMGAYYLRLGFVNEAIYRLEEAIELDPQYVDAHDLLGDAYYADNDMASALVQWRWVQAVDPSRSRINERIAKANSHATVEKHYRNHSSAHFIASFAPGTLTRDLNKVLSTLERAYRDIGRKLGSVGALPAYPPTPIQVVIYTANDFTEATQLSEHVGAVYDGKIRVPLTDKAGNMLSTTELERRLYHEYVHVVVRHLTKDSTPWWLNEGLAETLSNDLGPQDIRLLQQAARDNALFSLSDLETTQLDRLSVDQLRLAYTQAHATVEYLWSRLGRQNVLRLLGALGQGQSIETALRQHCRRTYSTL
jgi:hypothetical protein